MIPFELITIWDLHLPLKIKIHMWLILQDGINTKDKLIQRGWSGDPSCVFCFSNETLDHLFLLCEDILLFWTIFNDFNKDDYKLDLTSIKNMWLSSFSSNSALQIKMQSFIGIVWWVIWLNRNKREFNSGTIPSIIDIYYSVSSLLYDWTGERLGIEVHFKDKEIVQGQEVQDLEG